MRKKIGIGIIGILCLQIFVWRPLSDFEKFFTEYRTINELRKTGETTTAQVERVYEKSVTRNARFMGKGPNYNQKLETYTSYSYIVDDTNFTNEVGIDDRTRYNIYKNGNIVNIIYNKEEPQNSNIIHNNYTRNKILIDGGIRIIFMLLIVIATIGGMQTYKYKRER